MTAPHCDRCGNEFKWVRLASGDFVPVDPDPSPAGHLVLLEDGERGLYLTDADRLAILSDPDHAARSRVYLDHRKTCVRTGATPRAIVQHSRQWERREATRRKRLAADRARDASLPRRR